MAITVSNQSTSSVLVAINEWGGGGDTSFFTLPPISSPITWDRTDLRGFIMSIEVDGSTSPFFVSADDNITLMNADNGSSPIRVIDNGSIINPLR